MVPQPLRPFGSPRLFLIWLLGRPASILALVALVAFADAATGWELSFGAFYLVPVALVALHHDRVRVVAIALLSALAWLLVDLSSHPAYRLWAAPYWNAGVRLVSFMAVGLLLNEVKTLQARERDLTAFLVHDLRNPLTSLDLSLQRLGESEPAPERRLVLRRAESAVRRLDGLVDSLVESAQLQAGRGLVARRPFSLTTLVQEALDVQQALGEHRGVAVHFAASTRLPLALGDERLCRRVVENLLSNALKSAAEGQEVTVMVDRPEPGRLRLHVADPGAPIPSRFRRRAFDPAVQMELRRMGAFRGSGLGLTFCRDAVEAQGGRIWIESGPGRGNSVFVTLPAEEGSGG